MQWTERKFLPDFFHAGAVIGIGAIFWVLLLYLLYTPTQTTVILQISGQSSIHDTVIHDKKNNLFILKDSSGLQAVSAICTHRQCPLILDRMVIDQLVLSCPCHGGKFTPDGTPVSGPVNKPLNHYYIYKDARKRLVIDMKKTVSSEARFTQ
ncbi:MAG: Rieske (2Fe-2S) protein [Chitinivibrionales bacterium]|nr:Rieske (2Fe-2S) protein [Chitinivibrionales bacterium]